VPPGPYLVAGVGRAGRAAVGALTRHSGSRSVHVWDGLGGASQREAAAALADSGVGTTHGSDGIALLDEPPARRTVVKSPGLPASTPVLDAAARRGLAVIDEAELGWRLDPRPLVAVTGTNGKSTTASLVAAVLLASGRSPVSAGNTTFGVPYSTAPDCPGDVIVAELSSFQLEGCPVLLPDAAVLTNLTHDHLYRHRTVEEYERCKRRLFIRDGTAVPAAAIGIDQECGRTLARDLRDLGSTVVTFGCHPEAQRRVIAAAPELGGGEFQIAEGTGTRTIRSRLTGAHNALNVAGALALADALGIETATASAAIEATDALPGRYEQVRSPAGYDVVVDYAHNPDGVEQALDTARAIVQARGGGALRVVLSTLALVGREQAQAVGRAGGARADHLILTTNRWTLDDPPDRLPDGLLEGAQGTFGDTAEVQTDRARAIERAIRAARAGDLVLILDRGERDSLVYDNDDRGRRFDDRDEVRALLASLDT
jgi:UDP-N-acetylmuramoylalanine-D-glutamate ligase